MILDEKGILKLWFDFTHRWILKEIFRITVPVEVYVRKFLRGTALAYQRRRNDLVAVWMPGRLGPIVREPDAVNPVP